MSNNKPVTSKNRLSINKGVLYLVALLTALATAYVGTVQAKAVEAFAPVGVTHNLGLAFPVKIVGSNLDVTVTKMKDSNGTRYLDFRFSNGSTDGITIPFSIVCKRSDGSIADRHNSHQFLGTSRFGSVVRNLYFKVSCPDSTQIGVLLGRPKVSYNLIGIALTAATAYYFPITF